MNTPDYSKIYDVSASEKVYKLIKGKKLKHIQSAGLFFYEGKTGRTFFCSWEDFLNKETKHHPLSKEFISRYEFKGYAYLIKDVKTIVDNSSSSKKFSKEIEQARIITNVFLNEEQEEEKEEEDMNKLIKDTGATFEVLDPEKFLSVSESKEFFRLNKSAKTKYAWYENKSNGEVFVTLEFYKNTDYSNDDINWLSHNYKYLYFAFEKNGAPIELTPSPQVKEKKTKQKPVEKTEQLNVIKTEKVSQSSSKILMGMVIQKMIVHNGVSSDEFLNIDVCKRLWILQFEGFDGWNWYIDKESKKSVFCTHESLTDGHTFVCKAYRKCDFKDIDELYSLVRTNIKSEEDVKQIVNAVIYERRFNRV